MVPTGMTSQVHAFDPREGGSFRISLTYDEPTATGKTTAQTDTYHGRFEASRTGGTAPSRALGARLVRVRDRWGPEGPPPDAYSRVTDPERFRPLHGFALTLLDELQGSFEVERVEAYGLERELEDRVRGLARPTIRLVPADRRAAPLTVVFTAFPGLIVRAGHWCSAVLPSCGCDACAEMAEDEIVRLREMVDNVVAGRFHERISLPLIGSAWEEWELWSPRHRSGQRSRLERERARAMVDEAGRSAVEWVDWPRRGSIATLP